ALTAVCQRRDGRPAAFRPAAQRRMAGRAILLLREEWAKPRGRRSRASHCGGQAGERSDRIVARDPPVKGPPGRVVTSSPPRRALAQPPSRGDATPPHQRALRYISAPSCYPEGTRSARHVRAGDNGEAQSGATEAALSEMPPDSKIWHRSSVD